MYFYFYGVLLGALHRNVLAIEDALIRILLVSYFIVGGVSAEMKARHVFIIKRFFITAEYFF